VGAAYPPPQTANNCASIANLMLFFTVRYRAFGQLPATTDAELLIDVAKVGFHGLDGEMELLGDLPV
jgi:hypothetical protein